jgi:hypothetical protein
MSLRRTGSPARCLLVRWPLLSPLLLMAAVGGCSTTARRDQYYGTDAGTTYQPSEAGAGHDAAPRDGADGGAASDADAAHADDGGETDTAADAP